jgi:hypothetical protein
VPKARKIILVIVLVFVVYAVINSPEQSADVVKSAFDTLLDGLQSIGLFFDRLLTG